MERRQYLKMAGMASVGASVGLAGCSDGGSSDGDGNGEAEAEVSAGVRARYDGWVSEGSGSSAQSFITSVDIAGLPDEQQPGGSGSETEEESSGPETEDPLATTSLGFLFISVLTAGFGTVGTGLGQIAEEDGGTEVFHVVGNSTIFEGSYDPGALGTSVEQAGGVETESYGGYTLYLNEGSQDETVIGVAEDAVVVTSGGEDGETADPLAAAKSLIDANNGDGSTFSDSNSEFDDLVTALPDRHVMGVIFTEEPRGFNETGDDGSTGSFADTELSGLVHGVSSSGDFNADGSLTTSLAARYESEGEVDARGDIESAIGAEADEQTVNIDGPLAIVEGTYNETPSLPEQ